MPRNPGADRVWQIADEFGLEAVESRCVGTAHDKRHQVEHWIQDQDIEAYWTRCESGLDHWFLPNTDQRIVFIMRWS